MIERRTPTHVLRIEVPLKLDGTPHDYDPVKDAVCICLSISRAAFSGHICGDATLTLTEPAFDEEGRHG